MTARTPRPAINLGTSNIRVRNFVLTGAPFLQGFLPLHPHRHVRVSPLVSPIAIAAGHSRLALGQIPDYNREPILQSCTVMAVGRPSDNVPNDAIYSDCSATKGASGSPVLVRSQNGELRIKGVYVGGGQDTADYTGRSTKTPAIPWSG
jgi:hypothetical protein